MRHSRGFSLIETLIAMFILAGALIVLTHSWSGSLLAIRKMRTASTVANLLNRKAVEYEVRFADKPLDEVPESEEGDFGKEYLGYKWSVRTQKLALPDLTTGLAARKEGVSEMELTMVRMFQDFLENSVKELQVTVYYTRGDKTQEYSVTTYLVDYKKAMPTAGAGP